MVETPRWLIRKRQPGSRADPTFTASRQRKRICSGSMLEP